ncbi:MAG: T9SS type A sorting domain-containing protein [candidate division WOR-3 bacterium]|nr:T9SS type A sorting domain-containing protein [candidate division WOR-3 bacterium]
MLHIPIPFSTTEIEEQKTTKRCYPLTLRTPMSNPFKTLTAICYSLPVQDKVSLQIYDINGRLIKTLVSETKPADNYSVHWNGRDNKDEELSPGIYFARLMLANKSIIQKVIKIKQTEKI